MKTLPFENAWENVLVEVLDNQDHSIEPEINNTPTWLVEREINHLEIAWLKERDQYKLADGLGNIYFPDKDFSYRLTMSVLQNVIGILLFCSFMKYHFIIFLNFDKFLLEDPEFQSTIISAIIAFVVILISLIISIVKMLKKKKRFGKAKMAYLNKKNNLLIELDKLKN